MNMVVHPQLLVRRDVTGRMIEVIDDESLSVDTQPDVARESWMHVEVDRLPDGDDPSAIVEDIQRVLRDVREAVED